MSTSSKGLPSEVTVSKHIVLRGPRPDDAEAMFANVTASRTVTRYLSWSPHESASDTKAFLTAVAAENESSIDTTWVISDASGAPIGLFSCWFDRPFSMEVGFCLGENWWNRGIMTAALIAVIDLVREKPAIYRVWATCDPENVRSAGLLNRTGFTHEGTLARHAVRPNLEQEPRGSELYGLALR